MMATPSRGQNAYGRVALLLCVERCPPGDSGLEGATSHCDLLGVPDRECGEHLLKVSLIVFGPWASLGERWGSHAQSMHAYGAGAMMDGNFAIHGSGIG